MFDERGPLFRSGDYSDKDGSSVLKASTKRRINSLLGGSWILTYKDFDFRKYKFVGFETGGV